MDHDELIGSAASGQNRSYTETNDSTGYKGYVFGGGIILVLAVSLGFELLGNADQSKSNPSPEPSVETALQDAARETQQHLPSRYDSVTLLTTLEASGRTLTYGFSIASDLSDTQIAALRASVHENFRTQSCSVAQMRAVISRGATIAYRYVDLSGDVIDGSVSSCA